MNNKTLKWVFWGFALLVPMWASAQEYDSELQLSDEETVYWYRICSAATGLDGYAMTDLNGHIEDGEDYEAALRISIPLLPTETDDRRSQWKLTAGEDGKVIITNRLTGSQISNVSNLLGDHNITTLAFSSDAQGFVVSSLGDYAFKLESVEDDGVNRCLALADKDGEALVYPESDESTSCIGWKFFPVEIETGISSKEASRSAVSIKNRRISVTGSEWQLFDAEGKELPRTIQLPTGVYMVRMPQRTVKVVVR